MSYTPPFPGQPFPGQSYQQESDKSFVATWLLSWFFGTLGIDRFYLGHVGLGVAKLLTFGGCGIWAFVDLVLVLSGNMKDVQGRALAGYQQNKTMAIAVTVGVWLLGVVGSAMFLMAANTVTSVNTF